MGRMPTSARESTQARAAATARSTSFAPALATSASGSAVAGFISVMRAPPAPSTQAPPM